MAAVGSLDFRWVIHQEGGVLQAEEPACLTLRVLNRRYRLLYIKRVFQSCLFMGVSLSDTTCLVLCMGKAGRRRETTKKVQLQARQAVGDTF